MSFASSKSSAIIGEPAELASSNECYELSVSSASDECETDTNAGNESVVRDVYQNVSSVENNHDNETTTTDDDDETEKEKKSKKKERCVAKWNFVLTKGSFPVALLSNFSNILL